MKIHSLRTSGVGPLAQINWEPSDCEVVFDDNQRGKTTIIDILIRSVFKEGRKKIFQNQNRYQNLEDTAVTLQFSEDNVTFRPDESNPSLSEILNWNLAELHRFLCIRSSQVGVSGPRDRSEMWQSLASVIGGLEDDRIDRIKKEVRSKANLTGTGQWTNQKPNYFKEKVQDDLVSKINEARKAEEKLRNLIQLQEKKEKIQSEIDERETVLNQEIKPEINQLKRKIQRKTLQEAEEICNQAIKIQTKLQREYGRIDPEFEEPWADAKNTVSHCEQQLEKKKREREQINGELDEQKQLEENSHREFQELSKEIQQDESKLEERTKELDNLRRDFTAQKTSLRMKTQALEDSRSDLERWESWWRKSLGMTSVIVTLGLVGLFLFETRFRIFLVTIPGFLSVFVTGIVYYVRSRKRDSHENKSQILESELQGWPPVEVKDDILDRSKHLLDLNVMDLFPDKLRDVKALEESVQEKKEDRSAIEARMDELNKYIEQKKQQLSNLNETIQNIEGTLEDVEEKCESFRKKTGLPDFNQYSEKVTERRQYESELQSKRSKLSVVLDVEESNPDLSMLEANLKELLSDLDEKPPDQDQRELEEELQNSEQKRKNFKQEIENLREEFQSLEQKINNRSEFVYELGISLDEPEELFRLKHQWAEELNEIIVDRIAANVVLKLLKDWEQNYMQQVENLLDGKPEGTESITEFYSRVMGEEYEVKFDSDRYEFLISDDSNTYEEAQLSTGAYTHLYLSCRLVVMNHLFPAESGFMILDDPFLSYFPARKKKAVKLFQDFLQDGWQILLFTVDPRTKKLFEEFLGAHVKAVDELQVQ